MGGSDGSGACVDARVSSISVVQWLLNADSTSHSPAQRLTRFFTTLHSCLRNPSRAVFQFYPSSDDQVHMLTSAAQRAGFGGGVVVDYPNSAKKRKMYLCLMVGQSEIPKGLGENGMEVGDEAGAAGGDKVKNEKRRKERAKGKKAVKGAVDKEWILKKKDLYRTRGKEGVPRDSKVSLGTSRRVVSHLLIAVSSAVHREKTKAKVLDSLSVSWQVLGRVCILV